MYAPYFGLSKAPFSIAPDPHFLYLSDQHREALAHLLYGLGGGGGFVLLTGEIGAGKTTVCRCFLEQVPEHCAVAYVFNPKLTALELLQSICGEFGLPAREAPARSSLKALVDDLNDFLLALHAQGRQAVLVIDEAQSLSADVLEQLRLLTNLETTERKLLQIVLIGQPELRQMLARPEMEQLAQRVIARYHLGALSAAQTRAYLHHRLAVAGVGAATPFDSAALDRIHTWSHGVPRRINLLADRALLGAYAQGLPRAGRRTVDRAAREVFGTAPRIDWAAGRFGLVLAATLLLGGGLGFSLHAGPGPGARRPAAARADAAIRPPAPVMPPERAASAAGQSLSDPAAVLALAAGQPAAAWRQLALRWPVPVADGEPCVTVRQAGIACLHSAAGGLPLVRLLDRPGLLTLHGPDGRPSYVLLTGLGPRLARLEAGGQAFTLSLPALASIWRGDFASYWKPPVASQAEVTGQGDAALQAWIEPLLAAAVPSAAGTSASDRVRAFQLSQGLPADGVAGPQTLIALSRLDPAAADASAPRLDPIP
jgi:general secretion pathway protein A